MAAHAQVSIGTVSNVLNSPDKVTDKTRRKVQASIAELGFVRNDAARSLAVGTSNAIGLVVADLGNSFFVDIARGAESVMRRHSLNVMITNSDVDREREVRNLELFEASRVAGIIFAPLDTPFAQSSLLPAPTTPIVLVNYESPTLAYAGVIVDEGHGGALAARHLLALGRRRLLFVGGPMFLTAVRARREGVAHAVAEIADAQLDTLEVGGLNLQHGRQAGHEIIRRGAGEYDAVIAASDLIAIGLIQVLNETPGFRVPVDVAVTGYDDNHFAAESAIPVTTVAQPGEEMGRAAAELLLQHIDDPSTPNRTITLEPHLVPRRSTLGDVWRQ
ncbi:LacI family DNA-binding transcriptional regulator [Microbacterium atlanticum]|uniref:LacI family DNA-binding transcriptional regulator n=1 Tax=Microbacterium atlanticum TaxID=2782168 RepID=UPI001889B7A6|nr:LacI family DNA-binding transcriptional regulator [Microbacterium atlanticum]